MVQVIEHNNLRRIREQRGLSQAALAEKAGVSTQTVYLMEKGRRSGSPQVRFALARALEAEYMLVFPPPVAADEGEAA
jgi:DNA-binding XRE family transcriptional regulator